MSTNIALLLSGGVDSAVATHLLAEQGLKPDLFYIKIGMDGDDELTCTAEEDIELSQATARRYGLHLEVIDLQAEYWERVVGYTMERIGRGLTPNPDVMCNKLIKFGAFNERVGCHYDRIATGHYARILRSDSRDSLDGLCEEHTLWQAAAGERDDDGFRRFCQELPAQHPGVWLGTAPDPVKDQTDFLAQLDNCQVEKLLLPIGHLPKSQVRNIALEAKLPSARRKDSQGICFLGKINYNDFVRRYLGEREGNVVEIETGRKVGTHRGYWFHTIGQRKGLGLGGGPWFVVKKDTQTNTLFVSHGYDTLLQYGHRFALADFHFLTGCPLDLDRGPLPIRFKIRHTTPPQAGTLSRRTDGSLLVESPVPLQGIAPGQFGVIYDAEGQVCLGSGEIAIADHALPTD